MLLCGCVALPWPVQAGAGAAGWPAPFGSLRYRLSRPRQGPATRILAAIGDCDLEEDPICLTDLLPGQELLEQRLLSKLRGFKTPTRALEASVAVEEEVGILRAGAQARQSLQLRSVLISCGPVLLAASALRCDEQPVKQVAPALRASRQESAWLAPFRKALPALSHRRSRRLVCGPIVRGRGQSLYEARVVLGKDSNRQTAIADIACRRLALERLPLPRDLSAASQGPEPPQAHELPSTKTKGIKAQAHHYNIDPIGGLAVVSLRTALDCIDNGGVSCQQAIAPLTELRLRALFDSLQGLSASRLQLRLDRSYQTLMAGPLSVNTEIKALLDRACPTFSAFQPDRACVVGPELPARGLPKPSPALARKLSASDLARLKATRAMIVGGLRAKSLHRRRIRCDQQSIEVAVNLRPGAPAQLVDVSCPKVKVPVPNFTPPP